MAMLVFPAFLAFSLFSLHIVFDCTPPGSTIALTASSCMPVRLQPLRACVEPRSGVNPPWQTPLVCKYDIVRGVLSALLKRFPGLFSGRFPC